MGREKLNPVQVIQCLNNINSSFWGHSFQKDNIKFKFD